MAFVPCCWCDNSLSITLNLATAFVSLLSHVVEALNLEEGHSDIAIQLYSLQHRYLDITISGCASVVLSDAMEAP